MFNNIKESKINYIVVYKLHRITISFINLEDFISKLKGILAIQCNRGGVNTYAVNGDFFDNNTNRILLT